MKRKDQIGVGDVQFPPIAKQYINQVLTSRRLSYGPFINEFEKEFARIHKVNYAIFCNSGTSALQVVIHALKIKYNWRDGDEIIVPALTFVATVNVIIQNNLKPVFVDVDPLYFEIDPTKIERKITKRTRAILPVHIGGLPADMDPILGLAKKHHLEVIEDSCETMFAKYKKKRVGSFGSVSAFSTFAAHILVTGVGGFACTNDPELAINIKSLVNHGRDGIYLSIDDDNVKNEGKLFEIVSKRFKFIDIGYSYRATEFEGALGVAQLRNWKTNIKKRQKNAQYLTEGLLDLTKYLQLPHQRPNTEHVYMFYPIIIRDNQIKRADLTFFLEKNMIETRYLLPLLSQPVYKKMYGNIVNDYPVAKYISERGFYIGCHPSLTIEDMDYMIKKIHIFFRRRKYI